MAGDAEFLPRASVGAVVFREGAVLLVLRGRPPCAGEWAIPGGKLQWGETLQEGAEREVLEETGVRIRAGAPVFAFDLFERGPEGDCRQHHVVIDLEAEYLGGEPIGRDDALEARWVRAEELDQLRLNATTRQLLRDRYGMG